MPFPLLHRENQIKALRNSIISEAKAEAREIVSGANRQIEQTIREIKEAQADKEKTKVARAKVTELKKELEKEETKTESDLLIDKKIEQILARRQRQQERREERARRAGEEPAKPAAKAADRPEPLKVGDKVRLTGSDMVGNAYYALGDGVLRQAASTDNALSPYRWYVAITDRNGAQKGVNEVKVKVWGEDATSLTPLSVSPEGEKTAVYDLSGRRIAKENATKGLYIVNGKKMMVR